MTTRIKSSGIIAKGNLDRGEFGIYANGVYDYLALNLICNGSTILYIKLLDFYNIDIGYAFPTIKQLRIITGIRSKTTIDKYLDELEAVGLISKKKTSNGNNIYIVYKPLPREELFSCVPDHAKDFEEFKTSLDFTENEDKDRFQQFQKNKPDDNQPDKQVRRIEPKAPTRQPQPKQSRPVSNSRSPEDIINELMDKLDDLSPEEFDSEIKELLKRNDLSDFDRMDIDSLKKLKRFTKKHTVL